MMEEIVVRCENLSKSFKDVHVLRDFNLEIPKNAYVCIQGESGCGKSTFLNIVGLLDSPSSGSISIFNEDNVKPFSLKAQKMLREKIGYLFQNFALIDNMTVFENLELAIFEKKKKKKELIHDALNKVGLEGFESKFVFQCSGGEQQRIAIARLLLKPCDLVLCDEPTGSLDDENKKIILDLLDDLHDMGKTIIVVSHEKVVANRAQTTIELKKLV